MHDKGGGDEDIEGGSENLYTLNPKGVVDAHPGLNVNQTIPFSSMQMFLMLCLCIW